MRKSILLLLSLAAAVTASADTRLDLPLREVASLQGVRGNMLMGYGLVVGLKGTGDTIQSKFTIQTLANLMARQGISIPTTGVNVKNVASVMVTAELPAFSRPGQRVDITVSSNGDASSLAGGTLLMTPLQGPDGAVYVVGQGPILVGGFSVATAGASNIKNHPTAGRIPEGGLVEREVAGVFNDRKVLRYSLLQEDFTTAVRVVKAINQELPAASARALDARTIEVPIPSEFLGRTVELVARLENLPIELQSHARVVVNEKTGTVIMGSDVHIGAVSIVQAGLSISVVKTSSVSQPNPLSKGKTTTTGTAEVKAEDEKVKSFTLEPGTTVGRLAEMLNNLGVTPRDLVAILQAMKDAGALNAELRIL
jgi:flagellar P-ring protein precursor FlgI